MSDWQDHSIRPTLATAQPAKIFCAYRAHVRGQICSKDPFCTHMDGTVIPAHLDTLYKKGGQLPHLPRSMAWTDKLISKTGAAE